MRLERCAGDDNGKIRDKRMKRKIISKLYERNAFLPLKCKCGKIAK